MPSPPSSPVSTQPARFSRFVPFVVLFLLPILLLWRVVFLGEAFVPADLLRDIAPWRQPGAPAVPWNPLMWDGIAEFYPWRAFYASTVHSGHLPLWNPHQFCGTPFAANSQSAIFYPLNLLFVILPVKAAFGVNVILHLFLTGAFLYVFLRRSLNLARASALIGAVSWQLCTWQVSWLELPTFLCVSTWIPAALLAIDCLRMSTSRRRSLFAAFRLGVSLGLMILAGHLQICFYGFLLIAAYGICRLGPVLVKAKPGIRRNLICGVVVSISIAALLGLAQVLPAVELSRMSHRAGGHPTAQEYGSYVALAVPVYHLATLILPQLFGSPTEGTYWGATNYAENACYIGLAALLLAIAGTMSTWRSRPETRFFAIAGVLALLFAVGTPLNALLYFGVPGFAQSGSPGRIMVLWSLCGAILAGVGAQAMLYPTNGKRRVRMIAAGVITIGILAVAFASLASTVQHNGGSLTGVMQQVSGETMLWRVPLVVVLVTAGALWQFAAGKLDARRASIAILVVVAIDLLSANVGYNRTAKSDDVYPVTPSIAYLQKNAGVERVMPVNRRWSLDPAHPPAAVLPPNGATVYGLYDTQGYDSLFPGQYMGFATAVNGDRRSPAPDENGNMVFTRGLTSPEAQALSPRYVLSLGELPPSIPATNLSQATTDGDVSVYENAAAQPRFTIQQNGSTVPVQANVDDPSRLDLSMPVTAGVPATLVVRDQWYPGWKANVDGTPAMIDKAPFIFRAVRWTPATSGTAHVTLQFVPSTSFIGIYLLCLGWSIAVGALVYSLGVSKTQTLASHD